MIRRLISRIVVKFAQRVLDKADRERFQQDEARYWQFREDLCRYADRQGLNLAALHRAFPSKQAVSPTAERADACGERPFACAIMPKDVA